MSNEILRVENLKKEFISGKGKQKKVVQAVQDISFTLQKGETLGIVGESGCGKSTTGRTIIRLLEPTEGKIFFKGENIMDYNKKQMKDLRKKIQIIFQDPYSSLNTRFNVQELIGEALIEQGYFPSRNAAFKEHVEDIAKKCGLEPFHLYRYPHQFSGGQRQRIGIARALALNPEFVVCDEPVSALDVSIQSSIINLLMDLQKQMGLSYLFISHDLGVVRHISDRIGVMYLGRMVELVDRDRLFEKPKHPYTEMLLAAIPVPDPSHRKAMNSIIGEIPSNVEVPPGCAFASRCVYAQDICRVERPEFVDKDGDNHFAACHFPR